MRIAIVGAGALGRAYGVRLALGGEDVRFVVRPSRLKAPAPFVIEQVNGDKERSVLDHPELVSEIPADTEIAIVTVHHDQLVKTAPESDGKTIAQLLAAGPSVPIVTLTPLFPKHVAALESAAKKTILPGMPGVTGYIDDRGVLRYWVPRSAMTFFDMRGAGTVVEDLARRLTRLLVPTQLERDVGALNAATTVAFFPFTAALGIAGSVDAVLANKELVAAVIEAAKECEALAKKTGRVASWAVLLGRFIGPFTLKPGVMLARRIAPEAVKFVEAHFGPKLSGQHALIGEAILGLGREQGMPMPELTRLLAMRSA
ncbi:MAG: 2-dehydropantoate 2-reductase N-terminal domain-containing protein [Polyangiaceae bacterium]